MCVPKTESEPPRRSVPPEKSEPGNMRVPRNVSEPTNMGVPPSEPMIVSEPKTVRAVSQSENDEGHLSGVPFACTRRKRETSTHAATFGFLPPFLLVLVAAVIEAVRRSARSAVGSSTFSAFSACGIALPATASAISSVRFSVRSSA